MDNFGEAGPLLCRSSMSESALQPGRIDSAAAGLPPRLGDRQVKGLVCMRLDQLQPRKCGHQGFDVFAVLDLIQPIFRSALFRRPDRRIVVVTQRSLDLASIRRAHEVDRQQAVACDRNKEEECISTCIPAADAARPVLCRAQRWPDGHQCQQQHG